jgi:uncharacterized protein (TIGR02271 family)
MNPPTTVKVTDPQGVQGTIDVTAWPLDGRRAEVPVSLEGGRQVWVPVQMLIREAEGRYAVPMPLADLERRPHAGADSPEPPLVLPVLEEVLDVQTRRVETGRVRLHKTVRAREVLVDEPLLREEVVIERVPVNRVVEGPIPVRYEGDTMILSLLEEVLVVETRLPVEGRSAYHHPADRHAHARAGDAAARGGHPRARRPGTQRTAHPRTGGEPWRRP